MPKDLVAPLVGAWIEIFQQRQSQKRTWVAPLVGAWIEIVISTISRLEIIVAPLVGAWIEIRRPLKLSKTNPASLLL